MEFHGIDSNVELIIEGSIQYEGNIRIVIIICRVWRKEGSNTHTIWWLSAGDENSIPALKINIYETWPTRFHTCFHSIWGIDFYLHNPSQKYRLWVGKGTSSVHRILKIKMIFSWFMTFKIHFQGDLRNVPFSQHLSLGNNCGHFLCILY